MKTLHAKSPCCQGVVYRFGNRRRRCKICGCSWRVRVKKRGRKSKRYNLALLNRVLTNRQTLKQASQRKGGGNIWTLQKRFSKTLKWFTDRPRKTRWSRGKLILIVDGLWFSFTNREGLKEDWVLYTMLLRSVGSNQAVVLDPVIILGKESAKGWRQAIDTRVPLRVRRRICAFISDGFRGSEGIAKENNWLFQRCHFHLLAQLQARRGRRKSTLRGLSVREMIYQTIRSLLSEIDRDRVKRLKIRLRYYARHPACPRKLRLISNDFLRNLDSFQTYLNYPELCLPNTVNSVESLHDRIRTFTHRHGNFRTPPALLLWLIAYIRRNPTITCNGKCQRAL